MVNLATTDFGQLYRGGTDSHVHQMRPIAASEQNSQQQKHSSVWTIHIILKIGWANPTALSVNVAMLTVFQGLIKATAFVM